MARLERFAFAVLTTISALLVPGFAQEIPALSISPGKVTMLQGETRTFRAVGKDGRIRHNVRWSVSPEHAAKLTTNGDEATVQAEEGSSTVTLTAFAEGDSAEATVDILSGHNLPTGTLLWTVPRCRAARVRRCPRQYPAPPGPTSTSRKSVHRADLFAPSPPTAASCGAGRSPAPVEFLRVSPSPNRRQIPVSTWTCIALRSATEFRQA